jgi:hypothetical protein
MTLRPLEEIARDIRNTRARRDEAEAQLRRLDERLVQQSKLVGDIAAREFSLRDELQQHLQPAVPLITTEQVLYEAAPPRRPDPARDLPALVGCDSPTCTTCRGLGLGQ